MTTQKEIDLELKKRRALEDELHKKAELRQQIVPLYNGLRQRWQQAQVPQTAANEEPVVLQRVLAAGDIPSDEVGFVQFLSQMGQQEREALITLLAQLTLMHYSRKFIGAFKNTFTLENLKELGDTLKKVGWDDRSLTWRIGVGSVLASIGAGGAGIAAFGGAIGLPVSALVGTGVFAVSRVVEEFTGKGKLGDAVTPVAREQADEGENNER